MTQPPQGSPPGAPSSWPPRGGGGYAGGPPAVPAPAPPAPRRTGPVVAAALAVVAVLVVSAVVVVSLVVGGGDQAADAGYPDYPAATGLPEPSPSSSTTATTSTGSTSTTGRPRMSSPVTPTGPRKVFALADHPLLRDPRAGLPNHTCHLPTWRSDPRSAQAFFTAASDCLDAAWRPLLERYDLPFVSPALHFPSGPSFTTECGTIQVGIATAAYYCENNLYVPFAGLQTDQYGDNPGVYLALFAHEYGHHVQEVSGLMDAAWERIYEAGQNSQEGLEMARRKELQAQCFSGMFLGAHVDRGGSITRDMYNRAWHDQETRGDDTSGTRDHGSNANYAAWWRAGAKDNRIVACNTFAAPSSAVS